MIKIPPLIRKEFSKGLSLTEFIKKRFGLGLLKISLFLILFYLTIFLIASPKLLFNPSSIAKAAETVVKHGTLWISA